IKTGAPNKRHRPPDRLSHPRNETCLPMSKDTIIVRGFPPPSATSHQSKQSEKPLKPVSTKSGEGQIGKGVRGFIRKWRAQGESSWTVRRGARKLSAGGFF